MQAIVLSAGFGSRLRPITERVAKPAVPLLNIPMIGFPIWHLAQAGVRDIVINLHHLPETVEACIKSLDLERRGIKIRTVIESPIILDSGGGVANARDFLTSDDFFVANADAIMLSPNDSNLLEDLLRRHRAEKAFATILTCDLGGVGESYGGVVVDASGLVRGFSKAPAPPPLYTRHYTGFMLLSHRFFEYASNEPSNILYDVLTKAIASGEKVATLHAPSCLWLETGDGASLLNSTGALLSLLVDGSGPSPSSGAAGGRALRRLLGYFNPSVQFEIMNMAGTDPGVPRRPSPGLYWLNGPILIGKNVIVQERLAVHGFAVIGDECQIGSDVTIENAILFPKVQVGSKVSLKDELVLPSV